MNAFLRCGPGRPPPRVAGSSISPVVTRLSAPASPEDWQSRASAFAKDEDSGRSLLDRDDLRGSEWYAGRRRLPASEWRSSASYISEEIGVTICPSGLCLIIAHQ